MNPLQALQGYGQWVWLDYIRRSLLTSGELALLIEEDGLRGVTSNPAIFEKAITGSTDYVDILRALAPQYQEAKALYEQVAIRDIQDAVDVLRRVYEQTRRATVAPKTTRQTYTLREPLAGAVQAALGDWRAGNKVHRLWAHDTSLWTGTDEGEWLGWLGLTEAHAAHSDYLTRLAAEAESRLKDAGVAHALLLGMGGSSLGPEVLRMTFGSRPGFPQFHVLDSTDPAHITTFENKTDLAHTLVIVSSKSGSTLDPDILFFDEPSAGLDPITARRWMS